MTTATLRAATTGAVAVLLVVCGGPAATEQAAERPLVAEAQYERWFDELSNWGRWGPDDEMGALGAPGRHRAVRHGRRGGRPRQQRDSLAARA